MSYPPSSQVYALSKGTALFKAPIFEARDPTSNDVGPPFLIQQHWVNTLTQAIWVLQKFSSSNGVVTAQWRSLGPVVLSTSAPTSSDYQYPLGQIWIDTTTGSGYILIAVSGSTATWENFAGSGSNYPITPYVVGPGGEADYQTIQAAIDAANAAGGGMVWVQPGTWTEDLTFYSNIQLSSPSEQSVIIVGTHTPPDSGTLNINRVTFQSATDVFSSAVAGTTVIIVEDTSFDVTNGHSFNLENWTGTIACFNIGIEGTDDGFINNTGGATVALYAASIGSGTLNSMTLSGTTLFGPAITINCPVLLGTGCSVTSTNNQFYKTFTFSGDAEGNFSNDSFVTGSSACIIHNSTGILSFSNVSFNSSNSPAIDGSGTGNLTILGSTFVDNSSIDASLIVITQNTNSLNDNIFKTNQANVVQSLSVINTNDTAPDVSSAAVIIEVGGLTQIGDAYLQLNVGAAGGIQSYALGPDTSDSQLLKITTASGSGANPSAGSLLFLLDPQASTATNKLSLGHGTPEIDTSFTINGVAIESVLSIDTEGADDLGGIIDHRHTDVAALGAHWIGLRSRGTHASPTIVQSGDLLGQVVFGGYDGTDYAQSSAIYAYVDGTPGSDDMPGRLILATSADGAQTPTERIRVSQNGAIRFNSAYTFPTADGTANQVLQTDGAGNLSFAGSTSGTTVTTQIFTTNGTYTPTAGMQYCIIEAVGGGGGGAGAPASGASAVAVGGGGGGAAYARLVASAATIGASQAVTIGTGGAGGVGLANGSNGTATTVGVLVSASEGSGGQAAAAAGAVVTNGGTGGSGGTGDFLAAGEAGTAGIGLVNTAIMVIGGLGGDSIFGGGASGRNTLSPAASDNGNAGNGYGGGGGGAITSDGGGAANGGAGSAGIVIITEFS